jgi:hypothetical protein
MKNLFTGILLLTVFSTLNAQYCNNFHRKYCYPSENEFFKYDGQSRSALFSKGQKSELAIIVYKGQDYRISLCADANLGNNIIFRIYEVKKVKVEKVVEHKSTEDEYKTCETCKGEGIIDGETCYDCDGEGQRPTGNTVEVVEKETQVVIEKRKELLYDNSQDDFAMDIEFSAESTRKLLLEVEVPENGGSGISKGIDDKGKGKKKLDTTEMGCIGVLIEHMPTPKSGF